jgi:hypothetical protein
MSALSGRLERRRALLAACYPREYGMILGEALARSCSDRVTYLRCATGTDGEAWYWAVESWRTGGRREIERYVWTGRAWETVRCPDPGPAVDWVPGYLAPPRP